MPHCVFEYSSSLEKNIDINQLMQNVHQIITASGLFDAKAVKLRAMGFKDYYISSSYTGFFHVRLSILSGRPVKSRQDLAKNIQSHLLEQFSDTNIAITTEIHEMDPNVYQK